MVGLNVRLCSRCVQQLPTTTPTALPTGLPTLAPSQVQHQTGIHSALAGLNVRRCSWCMQAAAYHDSDRAAYGPAYTGPLAGTDSNHVQSLVNAHTDNLHLFVISAAHPASHDGSDSTADRPADDQPQSGSKPDAFAGAHRGASANALGDKAEDDALVLDDCRICLTLQGLAISVEV